MSLFTHLNTLSDEDKSKAVEKLITDSTPDFDFFSSYDAINVDGNFRSAYR